MEFESCSVDTQLGADRQLSSSLSNFETVAFFPSYLTISVTANLYRSKAIQTVKYVFLNCPYKTASNSMDV